ncbi:MAG TPA: class II SORL domain-containing protein [Synergistaceae bacterium]|nr:class II SORL domain-containing protein [Synergistaceae bacterium]HPJ25202.1 class II SORL domain-containing protein [Synergistaceae bacterium]HPQ36391.1 class II SORL domain-containing protein [Synergistaceae bacterium]
MRVSEMVQSGDWKGEKHVPVIEAPKSVKAGEAFEVSVSVGKEIAHPNTTEHHIRWIRLYFKPKSGKFAYDVGYFEFNAHGEAAGGPNTGSVYTEPSGAVCIKITEPGEFVAVSFCNIHGLWESSASIDVQ